MRRVDNCAWPNCLSASFTCLTNTGAALFFKGGRECSGRSSHSRTHLEWCRSRFHYWRCRPQGYSRSLERWTSLRNPLRAKHIHKTVILYSQSMLLGEVMWSVVALSKRGLRIFGSQRGWRGCWLRGERNDPLYSFRVNLGNIHVINQDWLVSFCSYLHFWFESCKESLQENRSEK